jgi:hypothetical protein
LGSKSETKRDIVVSVGNIHVLADPFGATRGRTAEMEGQRPLPWGLVDHRQQFYLAQIGVLIDKGLGDPM